MTKVSLKQIREGLKQGVTLYFVHASWCPYTVQFYPIFEKVMKNLKMKGFDTRFNTIKLDDVMTRSIRASYDDIYKRLADYDENIDEYKLYFPTVVMFVNGKRYKYNVEVRTVENFEAFIISKLPKQQQGSRNTKAINKSERSEMGVSNRSVPTRRNASKRIQTRPTKLLTLQEQIDKAFQKLFK